MTLYHYKALTPYGKIKEGEVEAAGPEDAAVRVRGIGLFPTQIKPASEVTAYREEPRPRVLNGIGYPYRIECTWVCDRGNVRGSFNIWGENGRLFILFEPDDQTVSKLKIDVSDTAKIGMAGLFRKRFRVVMRSGEIYFFVGDVARMKQVYETWRMLGDSGARP